MIDLRKRFTAYVIFVGSENRNFWRFFVRRGWRHVYVVMPATPLGQSLFRKPMSQIVNMWTDHIRSDVVPSTPEDVARLALKEGATCAISVAVDQKFSGRYLPRGMLTCVSLTKALLSIGAWWVWTPEQLAHWLLRHGGELVEKPGDEFTFQQTEDRQERAECADRGAEAPEPSLAAANG